MIQSPRHDAYPKWGLGNGAPERRQANTKHAQAERWELKGALSGAHHRTWRVKDVETVT
jgi:hypothetical protein